MPLLLSMGIYLLVACAIVGGGFAGINALLSKTPEFKTASPEPPRKKIGTERQHLPPLSQMKQAEVFASAKTYPVPPYAAMARAKAKQEGPKATERKSRAVRIRKEAREAYAADVLEERPVYSPDRAY